MDWEEAKRIIPGGNNLYSKRPERFLADNWPTYYSKCKGCEVWDLEGNHYYDFSSMGIGCCTLGYCDPDVDNAVIKAVKKGSMCTLNCPEEVELAEKLLELHPWADMVRFARTGGEACAIAEKIARTYMGIEGDYHGWYLSDKNNKVFIADPRDPRAYKEELPECSIRIFDEITTGFRKTIGGLHLLWGGNPDIAVFAKALGNGYPIAAIIGRRDVMMAAKRAFISSTFWSERIGFAAALATIEKMQQINSPEILARNGDRIRKGLKLKTGGLSPLLEMHYPDEATQKTYTEEMIRRGYLVGPRIYTSCAHTDKIIDKFIENSNEVLG
jgi:glutamate-1-semialdehyde 2,1-aminomutase